jgi:hypothetical protein
MKFKRSEWYVKDVSIAEARDIVERLHYAKGASNTRVFSHGLYRRGEDTLLGCAWWLPPTKAAAMATYEGDWRSVLSLSRLVVDPSVPTNGASFLIAHSIKLIREDPRWECLVTYADIGEGHEGTIYRATNWQYMGLSSPTLRWVDGDGRIVARKAAKSRTVKEMEDLGYERQGPFAKHKFRMVIA